MRDIGVEPIVYRLTQPDRHAGGKHGDAGADRIAGFTQGVHVLFEPGDSRRVGHEKRIGIAIGDIVPTAERYVDLAQLGQVGANQDAMLFRKPFARDRPCSHRWRRESRRRATAATIVADPELLPIGVVRMARAKGVDDIAVVAAALILIADQQRDRRTGGPPLEYARQYFDGVRLLALGHVARGSGFAQVEITLDIGRLKRHSGRAAVDHAANRRAVRFAEICHAKQDADRATGHDVAPPAKAIF